MSIKATVIGGKPVMAAIRPTSLGGLAGGLEAPEVSTARPTTIQPTALQPVTPAVAQTQPLVVATAIPQGIPAPKVSAATPLKASALPGLQRKTVEVTLDMLSVRFPGLAVDLKTRVQSVLAGVSPESMDTSAWLSFGTQAQEDTAKLVKDRLALMESTETRSVTQHLTRLQKLLGDVLDALEGGFLRKAPLKVWDDVAKEVQHLEGLLNQAYPSLMAVVSRIEALTQKNRDAGVTLHVNALAAEYLTDLVVSQAGSLLLSRLAALTTSQALALEQVQTLELDKTSVQELTTLVQDGVLLKLPAVYSQLAGLSAKPSDTQRFIAAEKLAEIVNHIQRKL